MNLTIGIDYSMSSPSICVHQGTSWAFSNCSFYFLSSKKKFFFQTPQFFGEPHKAYSTQEERFNNIADWAIKKIPKNSKTFIEGYAFGAKGVVFNIAENTGVLKHKIYLREPKNVLHVIPPSVIKKFATGKGNANKIMMYHSFVQDTQFDISATIDCNEGESPMSDIIDSYYIAKYAFHKS